MALLRRADRMGKGVDVILTAPYLAALTPVAMREASTLARAHGLTIVRDDDEATFWAPGETALLIWRPNR